MTPTDLILAGLFFVIATLYASVGHAGASGYIAAMALMSMPAAVVKPTALALNILVASIGITRFGLARLVPWRLVLPFVLASVPCAYLAARLQLPALWYQRILAVVLLLAAAQLWRTAGRALQEDAPGHVRNPPLWMALLAGAAIGVGPEMLARTEALVKARVDVVVLDSAHGHSAGILRALTEVKAHFPDLPVIAGNIATGEAAEALIRAGANGIKVGVGPGSICTTRIVAGVGVPQFTALKNCAEAAAKHNVPVIADGGIKFSGDICKAIGVGAHSVMIGSLFAGTDETPGDTFLYQGRKYKGYRGMGSIGAMKEGSSDRYFQDSQSSKLVPEGIEGQVPYRGPIAEMIYQLLGGLRSGMGYTGAATIEELHRKARFVQISAAGLRESHVHDVIITKEAPNYRTEGI